MTVLKKFSSWLSSPHAEDSVVKYEERRYPVGVIVLVILLTGVLVLLSERALDDLNDAIPHIPYPEFRDLPEERESREYYEETVRPLEERMWRLEERLRELRMEYDSSLLEKMSKENARLFGSEALVRERFREVEEELEDVRLRLDDVRVTWEEYQERAKEAMKPVLKEYEWKVKVRQAKVFGWEALFWIPFFLFSLQWHTRLRRRDSRWEVVSLSLLIAGSIISLQSVCIFLWSWIPEELLRWLWELLRATMLTRILGYYLAIALTIFLLGGLLVLTYRFLTDPARSSRRRIRHGLCPKCSYPLSLSHTFCGGCGKELRRKCSSCGGEGYVWASKCTHCGR